MQEVCLHFHFWYTAEDQIMKVKGHFVFAGVQEMCDDVQCVQHSAASDKQSSLF